jgi:stage II sporulation protein D
VTIRLPTRWLEVADSPAAAAAILTAVLCAAGVGSCARSESPSLSDPRAARPSPRAHPASAPQIESRAIAEPVVRVRILAEAREIAFSGPASLSIAPPSRPAAERTLSTPVTITRLPTGWLLRDAAGAPSVFGNAGLSGPPESLRVRSAGPAMLTINGSPHPGECVLVPRTAPGPDSPPRVAPVLGTDGSAPAVSPTVPTVLPFDVIEHLGIESYLPAVLSRELLPTWSLTAYKAQAVAARTYALHERERSTMLGEAYDLESNQLDQVYGGSVDHPVAARAVAETRGRVLTFEGRILRAYFSSTCGGRPAAAKDVWPTTKGFEFNLDAPIQGSQGADAACASSPRASWTITRPRDDLSMRLAAYGRDQNLSIRGLRSLLRVEPAKRTPDGRPTAYKVFDASGKWHPLSAEQLRTACNWVGSSGRPAVTAQTRVLSGDAEFTAKGADFIITGRGFGHGVGLCQYGAEGMARRGATPEEILLHYYSGATIETRY